MAFDFGGMDEGGFSGLGGFSGMSQGMSSGGGKRQKKKGNAVEVPLKVSLEDLYTGTQKKLKITRNKLDDGRSVQEEKQVEIEVKKAWKAGTKITFDGYGDEEPGMAPGDIIFVVQEKKHPLFTRDGNDLIHKKQITLSEALLGTSFTVKTLSGETITVDTKDEVVSPSTRKIISNKGMPIKNLGSYGDLVIEFDINFPKKLTNVQRRKIQELEL